MDRAPLNDLSTRVVEDDHFVDLGRQLLEGEKVANLQVVSYGKSRPPLIQASSSIDVSDGDVPGAASDGLQGDGVWHLVKVRPEGSWDWKEPQPRCYEHLAEVGRGHGLTLMSNIPSPTPLRAPPVGVALLSYLHWSSNLHTANVQTLQKMIETRLASENEAH